MLDGHHVVYVLGWELTLGGWAMIISGVANVLMSRQATVVPRRIARVLSARA